MDGRPVFKFKERKWFSSRTHQGVVSSPHLPSFHWSWLRFFFVLLGGWGRVVFVCVYMDVFNRHCGSWTRTSSSRKSACQFNTNFCLGLGTHAFVLSAYCPSNIYELCVGGYATHNTRLVESWRWKKAIDNSRSRFQFHVQCIDIIISINLLTTMRFII